MGTFCFESAENKQVIVAATKEDHIWSSKKMEGDKGLNFNTVEWLRGRLLAERKASRVAKEEEESMGNKLVELEKLLRLEIKLRDKAERRLKFLRKKLESLNTPTMSEQSDSTEKCANSSGSSSISSISKYEEANEEKHHIKNVALPENAVHNHNVSEDCDSHITDNSSCNSYPGYSFPKIMRENHNQSSKDLNNDESRHSSSTSKSSMTEDEEDHGKSMASVPVNVTITS
ncbi:hypothetical protein TanjilG_18655 [Lupinus angustifolius]|uniref:uncharacterized protein LOC109335251 isoform X1 n=1 Tax=Lupinus angustifolius TaxID=3871 RepID=UPI00090D3E47|nr:PREDICTED: uncharacterized protein LOC109335251 isoform X1 [Lupinus angustifolius]OIV90471.1 hypothetical protein TanjilG_18655 [Lupinus angustifolius]